MKHAAQDEDAHFRWESGREPARGAARGLGRNRDVPDIGRAAFRLRAIGGKGKHIGGAALVAEGLVQTSHRGIADKLHGHRFPREAQFSPDALEEIQ